MVAPHIDGRNVEFVGEASHEVKNELLGNATALLFPIQWHEPFGLVMIEAMACGTPVLALPGGAVREVVADGVSGWMCASVAEMAERARDLRHPRVVVPDYVDQQFSVGRMAASYESLYPACAGSTPQSVGRQSSGTLTRMAARYTRRHLGRRPVLHSRDRSTDQRTLGGAQERRYLRRLRSYGRHRRPGRARPVSRRHAPPLAPHPVDRHDVPLLLSSRTSVSNELFGADLTNPDLWTAAWSASSGISSTFSAAASSTRDTRTSGSGSSTTASEPVQLDATLHFGADFVDIFEVRGTRRERRGTTLPGARRPGDGRTVVPRTRRGDPPHRSPIRSGARRTDDVECSLRRQPDPTPERDHRNRGVVPGRCRGQGRRVRTGVRGPRGAQPAIGRRVRAGLDLQ